MVNHKKLLNLCYDDQTEVDVAYSKKNRDELQSHRNIDKFNEAEKKRKKIFQETAKDILELISLLKSIEDTDE